MSLLEKIFADTKALKSTMASQINIIEQISSESNNLLLELEAARFKETNNKQQMQPNMKLYKYNKKMQQTTTKALELYQRLPNGDVDGSPQVCQGFADFLQQNQQNIQFLSNNVRKAMLMSDTLQKKLAVAPEAVTVPAPAEDSLLE